MKCTLIVALLLDLLLALPATAATSGHGDKGFEFTTPDGRYVLQIDTRMQFRFSSPSDDDPVTYEPDLDQTSFELRRARLEVGALREVRPGP